MDTLHEKKTRLERYLAGLSSVAVAFSAGVDSTFLLKTAHNVLGDRAIAITVITGTFPERELAEAEAFCRQEKIRLLKITVDVFSVSGFRDNTPERCYFCKKELFRHIRNAAEERGILHVAEGSNVDDTGDYRPGMKAVRELGVSSPLMEAGLTKSDIRALSRELGLKTWDKPSFACLATRIAYGEEITARKLWMIDCAEQMLADSGFRQYRVRVHGDTARIELLPEDMERFLDPALRSAVSRYCHQLGFRYVSLDLEGYRTGSMNRGLVQPDK